MAKKRPKDSLDLLRDMVDETAKEHDAARGSGMAAPAAPSEPGVNDGGARGGGLGPTAKGTKGARGAKAKTGTKGTKGKTGTEDPPGTFYVYTDDTGMQHIVDSVKLVPKKHRKKARKWIMDAGDERGEHTLGDSVSKGIDSLAKTVETVAQPPPRAAPSAGGSGLHVPSVLLGLIAAAVLFLGSFIFRKRSKLVVKLLFVMVVIVIGGAAYLGWVRRQAGLGDEAMAKPKVMIDDARGAANLLQRRMLEQEEALQKIDAEPEPSSNF